MKKIIPILTFLVSLTSQAQTITFSGCPVLFGSTLYTFYKTSTDGTGRNVYQTTPIDAQSVCPSGTCEFQVSWNVANKRWEFIADSGDGDFVNPYLIYYNTAASTPNPPSLALGVWTENTSVTTGDCGGNLTSGNSTLSGDVQNNVLSKDDFVMDNTIVLFPNPVNGLLKISSSNRIDEVVVYNLQGQEISRLVAVEAIDFSKLASGIYLVKVVSDKGIKIQSIIRQ